jgi:sugar-specific transcriptional regulator TrmB
VNQVLIDGEDIRLLIEIGFTKTQAKVYLTLLKFGETDAKTLSKKTDMPKPEVYRTINELQKKSLVEKEITSPSKFIAIPIQLGLQILMKQKVQQCKETQRKIKQFLRQRQSCPLQSHPIQGYKLIMVEGRERIMQMITLEHDCVQQSVDILTTLQRLLQILDFSLQNHMEALERAVKYRVVVEKPVGRIIFPESIHALLAKPNFALRLSVSPLKTNGAIFDEKEVTFSFYPSKPLGESSIIWTNHTSFLSMFQDQFDKTWEKSLKYRRENQELLHNP